MRKIDSNGVAREAHRSEKSVAASTCAALHSEPIDAFDAALKGINQEKKRLVKINQLMKQAEQSDDDPLSSKIAGALRHLRRVLRAWDKFMATHQSSK